MSLNRREFLKLTAVTTLATAGGIAALEILRNKGLEAHEAHTPDTKPLTAKRWAMVVDTKKFKTEDDYKKVVDACRRAHNVPDFGNSKDEIKWIWTDTFGHSFPGQEHKYMPKDLKKMPFLLLCNHCDNPPCVRVCPTKATFKRKDGIVMMDFHRCIGCRFCMAACPFGARSFNWRDPRPFVKEINPGFPTRTKGVVEKCNFCEERLAGGLMPACVEALKGGLIFGDLEDLNSDVRKVLGSHYTIRRKSELGTGPGVYYII